MTCLISQYMLRTKLKPFLTSAIQLFIGEELNQHIKKKTFFYWLNEVFVDETIINETCVLPVYFYLHYRTGK